MHGTLSNSFHDNNLKVTLSALLSLTAPYAVTNSVRSLSKVNLDSIQLTISIDIQVQATSVFAYVAVLTLFARIASDHDTQSLAYFLNLISCLFPSCWLVALLTFSFLKCIISHDLTFSVPFLYHANWTLSLSALLTPIHPLDWILNYFPDFLLWFPRLLNLPDIHSHNIS